ncbi:MAG: isoaspartyl peptidase/L-asparaginase [Cryomorphaceae bacterium]|nr:MAG: isoaspartyl peptidase/L-asparaginase [Cryomorphaceae bacterium]
MTKYLKLITILLFFSCEKSVNNYAIVIHGGAGTVIRENTPKELQEKYENKLREALEVGYSILEQGGKSIDAVEETIKILEDSELFNAGRGSVLTNEETAEMDASIMTGQDLNAGAVATLKIIKNPISAARAVMEKSKHVFLSGEGAENFAKEVGLETISNDYFIIENQLKQIRRIKDNKYGTVGCVAIDKSGNITAGTSTGGMMNKKWNRIGDVPVIGAGTYANNKTCGISATGWGEYFIRNVVAYDISAMMEYKNKTLIDAARISIHNKVGKMGATGGVIGIDKNGKVMMEFNSPGMYRGYKTNKSDFVVRMFKD